MASEPKAPAEETKIDLFEDDDEFEEFEINAVCNPGRRSNFTQPEVGVANTMADKTQEQGKSKKKTKRELIYESPLVQEKAVDTSSNSTESLSCFKRSRSGRLLVPTLEFWRNQRVVNVADKETTAKDSGRSKKKTKRELIYESPLVQEKAVDTSSNSTESLSCFKRSRSGRLLVPTLEFWRNQRVVYDGDHKVIAFVEGLNRERNSPKVTRSEPRRKRGRL